MLIQVERLSMEGGNIRKVLHFIDLTYYKRFFFSNGRITTAGLEGNEGNN